MSEYNNSEMNQIQVPPMETKLQLDLAEPFAIPAALQNVSSQEPNKLSATAKMLEDEQARLRICQGKLKHATEDYKLAEKNAKDAEDSVEGLRRQLQELL